MAKWDSKEQEYFEIETAKLKDVLIQNKDVIKTFRSEAEMLQEKIDAIQTERINQLKVEISGLRETMLELIENAELKTRAKINLIEERNEYYFEEQEKQMNQLRIGLIVALILNIGQIVYEIIK
jgi:hypothetical protein